MASGQKSQIIGNFFDSRWNAYRDFLNLDLLNHKKLFQQLATHIQNNLPKDYAFLDLACGDCEPAGNLLKLHPAKSYVGVDIAAEVLKLSFPNLKHFHGQKTLIPLDFTIYLEQPGESFDLILLSYSLHHLKTEDKKRCIENARKKLNPGGFLAIIDGMRLNDQSREDWLNLCYNYMENKSQGQCPESCKIVKAHMIDADIPEEGREYVRMTKDAGFSRTELSLEDISGLGILFAHA